MIECKELITNVEDLYDWSVEIDPRNEGKELQKIVLELKTTMRDKDLIYLTAPQIGYKKRVFVIKFGKNDYRTFVNPVMTNPKSFLFEHESCYSIPDKRFIIPRFGNITIMYTTPLGQVESRQLLGKSATVFQHCLEHLNGLLISDIGLEIDEMFDNATDDEKAEILRMYAESLDLRQKALEEDIKNDSEINKLDEAIDFMTAVSKGEIEYKNIK